jgi:hypothetical protein
MNTEDIVDFSPQDNADAIGSNAQVGLDTLTILRAMGGLRLTKAWKTDGTIAGYNDAKYHTRKAVRVTDCRSLSEHLTKLERDPQSCVIRGCYVGDNKAREREGAEFKPGHFMRRKTSFDDQPLHTIMIDIDDYVPSCDPIAEPERAIEQYIVEKLPPMFHWVDHHWQLSGSAGHPTKAGLLKAHVWFWLKRPYTSKQLKTWAKIDGLDVDDRVFDSIQVHYTANPVFEPGQADPVPVRSGYSEGILDSAVDLDIGPLLGEHARKQEEARRERIARKPSGNSLIDWFNARHSIEDVMDAAGYETDGGKHWRSPLQTSGSFATMIFDDGLRWVSKSGSDAAAGIGMESAAGDRTGDAFDIFAHFQHAGDRRAALKAVSDERMLEERGDEFDDHSGDECGGSDGGNSEGEKPRGKKPGRSLVPFDQFIAELPTPDFVVDDIMQRGWLYSLTAPTGHGKTAVALEIAMRVATGTPLGEAGCRQGAVVYLAGENADDVRARCLMAAERELERFNQHAGLPIHFLDRVIKMEENIDWLFAEIKAIGGASLVVVDTAAAFFEGDDDNSNVAMGEYARMLRRICGAAGRPTVMVLCHPVKNPSKSNLSPRGGGAFLNEVDGNLRLWSDQRGITELHWFGKIRGREFEPITFRLSEAYSHRYKDSRDRRMASVIAQVMTAEEIEQTQKRSLELDMRVLLDFRKNPEASLAERCKALGLVNAKGDAQKSSLKRIVDRHIEKKLLEKHVLTGAYKITSTGRKVLETVAGSAAVGEEDKGEDLSADGGGPSPPRVG